MVWLLIMINMAVQCPSEKSIGSVLVAFDACYLVYFDGIIEQTFSNGISIASIVHFKLFCSQHICMTMLCDFKIVKLHAFWVCFQSIFFIPIYHTTITFPCECLQFFDCSIKNDRFTICWHIPSSRWSGRPAVVWCSAQIILYYGVTHIGCFLRSSLHSNTLWW